MLTRGLPNYGQQRLTPLQSAQYEFCGKRASPEEGEIIPPAAQRQKNFNQNFMADLKSFMRNPKIISGRGMPNPSMTETPRNPLNLERNPMKQLSRQQNIAQQKETSGNPVIAAKENYGRRVPAFTPFMNTSVQHQTPHQNKIEMQAYSPPHLMAPQMLSQMQRPVQNQMQQNIRPGQQNLMMMPQQMVMQQNQGMRQQFMPQPQMIMMMQRQQMMMQQQQMMRMPQPHIQTMQNRGDLMPPQQGNSTYSMEKLQAHLHQTCSLRVDPRFSSCNEEKRVCI